MWLEGWVFEPVRSARPSDLLEVGGWELETELSHVVNDNDTPIKTLDTKLS